jgi:hypothetical protein
LEQSASRQGPVFPINQFIDTSAWPQSVFVITARTGVIHDDEAMRLLAPLDPAGHPHPPHLQSMYLLPMNEQQCRFFLHGLAFHCDCRIFRLLNTL